MSSCSTHSGASGFGCRLCFQWNPHFTPSLHLCSSQTGQSSHLILAFHLLGLPSELCVSVLPPGLAERSCPSTQLSWPAQKEAAYHEHCGSLLVTSAGQGDVPALHHGCCAPTSAPLMRALHGLSPAQWAPPARAPCPAPESPPRSPAQQDHSRLLPSCPLTRGLRAEGMQHLAGGLRDDSGSEDDSKDGGPCDL